MVSAFRLPPSALLTLLLAGVVPQASLSEATAPPSAVASLQAGEPVEIIFDVDTLDLDAEAFAMAQAAGRTSLGPDEWAYRRAGLANLKQAALSGIENVTVLATWEYLGAGLLLVETEAALQALLARPEVIRLHANEVEYELNSDESLVMIGQDVVAAHAGNAPALLGEGSVVAILDTGVNYLDPFFGCTEPGVPADCPVIEYEKFAGDPDEGLDPFGHGTTVSAIVHLVAPKAKLVVADVLGGTNRISDTVAGMNWLIQKKVGGINIVAVNFSFGVSSGFSPDHPWHLSQEECEASGLASKLAELMTEYEIQPIAASGNQGMTPSQQFREGLTDPACVAGVVSVGSVYDEDLGNDYPAGTFCVDPTANEDQVSCFSQTATFLSLLAPGAAIDTPHALSGDHTVGTSFAAPHVSGAWAVLRAVFPDDMRHQTLERLTRTGRDVNDHRVLPNGRIKPRLDLLAALDEPDGDGVPLLADNCSEDVNPGELACDADGDGYGNICDCDLDQSNSCTTADIPPFKTALTSGAAVADINCSGATTTEDLNAFKALLADPRRPGPSGLPCVGETIPCTP